MSSSNITTLTFNLADEYRSPSLEYILSIWPVAESLARQTGVGDLIELSRTSKDLRAVLHGGFHGSHLFRSSSCAMRSLEPALGLHQTSHWLHLKSISHMHCTNPVHTKGKTTRPCVYCSKPICDACIVRDSFKKGRQDTFKNRLRYFCKQCWETSNATKCHRYTNEPDKYDEFPVPEYQDVSSPDPPNDSAEAFCWCTLKDQGWICIGCKDQQNSTVLSNSAQDTTSPSRLQCIGLHCDNIVDLLSPLKDRYRVCLWCEKPARRYWSSEDRYLANQKTLQSRIDEAGARQREIQEYNRQRWQNMRMSRKEMRGTIGSSRNDRLELVRHLDTVNYRRMMPDSAAPSPEAVYKSKRGVWQYSPEFLLRFQTLLGPHESQHKTDLDFESLHEVTRENGLQGCRTNHMFWDQAQSFRNHAETLNISARKLEKFNDIQVQLWNDILTQKRWTTIDDILKHLYKSYSIRLTSKVLQHLWAQYPERLLPYQKRDIEIPLTPPLSSPTTTETAPDDVPAYTAYDMNEYNITASPTLPITETIVPEHTAVGGLQIDSKGTNTANVSSDDTSDWSDGAEIPGSFEFGPRQRTWRNGKCCPGHENSDEPGSWQDSDDYDSDSNDESEISDDVLESNDNGSNSESAVDHDDRDDVRAGKTKTESGG